MEGASRKLGGIGGASRLGGKWGVCEGIGDMHDTRGGEAGVICGIDGQRGQAQFAGEEGGAVKEARCDPPG